MRQGSRPPTPTTPSDAPSAKSRPGFRGALLITSNEYNTANQLVATRTYVLNENSTPTPLTYTYFCYNSLGERTLTVSDMNLNSQIDWSDTDRVVSNDTRYVVFNGDWWRESSTWQTRQNGSSALTRVGLTRTRLTGLANNGDERLANNGEYPPTAQRSPEGAGCGILSALLYTLVSRGGAPVEKEEMK